MDFGRFCRVQWPESWMISKFYLQWYFSCERSDRSLVHIKSEFLPLDLTNEYPKTGHIWKEHTF